MKRSLCIAVFTLSSVVACNYTVGDCYPVGQGPGSTGVGASVISGGTGADGADGEGPLGQSQDALSGSACNATDQSSPSKPSGSTSGEGDTSSSGAGGASGTPMMQPQSPCVQNCEEVYADAALACGRIANAAQNLACQNAAYAAYKSCRDNCVGAQKTCLDMYEDCTSRKYSPCNKIVGETTLCSICQENCLKGGPYKFTQCTQCGFE